MANTKEIGLLAERLAEKYLREKGYQILDKNYAFKLAGLPRAEIDLIARDQKTIVFVEVKSSQEKRNREQSSTFFPGSKVNQEKQRKIIQAGQSWLLKNKISLNAPWRIDVVVVKINSNQKTAQIEHFPNAVFY